MTIRQLLDAITASDLSPEAKSAAWDLVIVGSLHTGAAPDPVRVFNNAHLDRPRPDA